MLAARRITNRVLKAAQHGPAKKALHRPVKEAREEGRTREDKWVAKMASEKAPKTV